MAASSEADNLRRANFRLCRLCKWPNYPGLGFNLENTQIPPYPIQTVESNSPAAAGGLKILDVLLRVNNQDVSGADYNTVKTIITNARDSNNYIDLLVIEKRFYEQFSKKGYTFDPTLARTVETPRAMPRDYIEFPKYTPRTCEMRLTKTDPSFGFEAVNGIRNIGASIQEVIPNTPASKTTLRKSDRIVEIDDKFVDNQPSGVIFDRLGKAKKKRAVKLYVVDTNTYKHFQDNQIPLASKEYQRSSYARQRPAQPLSQYINVADISDEPGSADADVPQPRFPIPTPRPNQQSFITETSSTQESHQDDIRLCTITRTSATDTYGIELIYHKRDQYHSLKLGTGRNNTLSNAALAGVKNNDHLIEINGENIESIDDNAVKQRIYVIKYPQPLQVLVVDDATYNYYKRQNKVIHSGLPSVRRLPENFVDRSISTVSSRPESSTRPIPTVVPVPIETPSAGPGDLTIDQSEQPRASLEASESNRRQYQLQRVPGSQSYGFTVISNQGGQTAHKITSITPNSPAEQQGLRVGDNIITVNNQNVQQMSATDFRKFLKTSADNAELNRHPLLLEVINDDSYQSPPTSEQPLTRASPIDPPYMNEMPNGYSTQKPSSYKPPERLSSRDESVKSTATQPAASRDGSQKLPPTQLINSQDAYRKLPSTQPTISRDSSQKSTTIQPAPYQNGSHRLPSTQLTTHRPYSNSPYDSPPDNRYFQQGLVQNGTVSSLLYRSRENLTRGTIDVVSRNRLLRYCRLLAGPSQAFGFQLKADDDKHIIYNIQPESPAMQAGLNENDLLVEVNNENVEGKSSRDVAILIRNAAHDGQLRLLIVPSSIKILSKRSAKSLTALNDPDYYRTSTLRSKYDDQDPLSSVSTGKHRSIPRFHSEHNYRDRSSILNNYLSEPSEPLPRKCVLQHDPSFRGCGFRLTEKENYDTPIIIEVSPNSPAKRSGLTEGDHIVYVDSQNVQNFRSFEDIIHLIQRTFEKYGQVTLVTLTNAGYHVLRKRGGYLESIAFDYQSSNIDQLKPRLCQLKLYNHEYDFGFTLQTNDYLSVKNIEEYSSADTSGLRKDDIILEINGRATKYLTIDQIKKIIETSKQERKLDLLVIDPNGYRFSIRHAIPLNSLLPIVQTGDKQITTSNRRHSHEPVYL